MSGIFNINVYFVYIRIVFVVWKKKEKKRMVLLILMYLCGLCIVIKYNNIVYDFCLKNKKIYCIVWIW